MQLPPITKKQQDILYLLYRFRFLNRIQIQTLLHHKTFNRVNNWLKDLINKNYIGKTENVSTTINTTLSTYYLARSGIKYVKMQPICIKKYIKRAYADYARSFGFVDQSLFIADIYISLIQRYDKTSGFVFYTRSDFTIDGIVKELYPHFVYRKQVDNPYYIAEIFTDNKPNKAIKSRITVYLHFFTQGDWIRQENPPNILFICPSEKMEQYVYNITKKTMDEMNIDLPVFVTTEHQLRTHSIHGDVWEKVVKDN
ncbi:MAG: hypothetical protein RI947_588 [Candidatus Parcubacteria bacterium]